MREPVNLAIVGASTASRVAQAFGQLPLVRVSWFCMASAARTRDIVGAPLGSAGRTTSDFQRVLEDEQVDAIAFDLDAATRARGPYEALAADKHVFLLGPLAESAEEAEDLVSFAESRDRRLRAYHRSVFSAGTTRLRALVARGSLGEIFYVRGSATGRAEPGDDQLITSGADLVAVTLHLLGDQPIELRARQDSYIRAGTAEKIDATLRFATGISARLHLSGVDHMDTRQIVVVGSRLTAVLDWELPSGLALYGGAGSPLADDLLEGGVVLPPLPPVDPLRAACESFVASIRSTGESGGARDAAAVVHVLDAIREASADPAAEPPVLLPTDSGVIELRAR